MDIKMLELLDKVIEIKTKKNKDYNSGGVTRDMYYLHGINTAIDDIYKKILRLISLISNNKKPECESIEDTCIDIIGYTLDFYIYYLKNRKD